jgi:hypothetical protein
MRMAYYVASLVRNHTCGKHTAAEAHPNVVGVHQTANSGDRSILELTATRPIVVSCEWVPELQSKCVAVLKPGLEFTNGLRQCLDFEQQSSRSFDRLSS